MLQFRLLENGSLDQVSSNHSYNTGNEVMFSPENVYKHIKKHKHIARYDQQHVLVLL